MSCPSTPPPLLVNPQQRKLQETSRYQVLNDSLIKLEKSVEVRLQQGAQGQGMGEEGGGGDPAADGRRSGVGVEICRARKGMAGRQ